MANFNLFMALFWLVLGVLVVWYHHFVDGDFFGQDILGSGIPRVWMALLAFLLVPYNLVRWYNARSYVANQQVSDSIMEARRRRDHAEGRHGDQPPDPNFNFSDRPKDGPG
jgi:hypothetical protein